MNRCVAWFSCGASSAVACKLAVEVLGKKYDVQVVNIDMSTDEHADNIRFLRDCEKWIGVPIKQIKSPKYSSCDDVYLKERYIAGVTGAACTKRLKRDVQQKYLAADDEIVIGFTFDEMARRDALVARRPGEKFLWPLIDARITKAMCFDIINAAGLRLPEMYRLGYNHANCIGCVKGGKGYWNKVRRDFPDVFHRRSLVERNIGYQILRDVWLDELDPNAGRDEPMPAIECGLLCEANDGVLAYSIAALRPEEDAE